MAQKVPKKSYSECERELKQQLSGGRFYPVYLICGEQDFLRHENMKLIREAILGAGDTMNSTVLNGPEIRAADVIETAQTLPFFADHRVVTITETEFFKHAGEDAERLNSYLQELPETTHLIFEEISPNKACRLYKTVSKLGYVLCCDLAGTDYVPPQDMRRLQEWIAGLFAERDLRISNQTLNLFLTYSGTDMLAIRSQKEKVAAYCWGRGEVCPEDIRAVCTPVVKDRIFDMIRFIAEGKREEALSVYMDLQKLQTPPQVILSLMIRQYSQLLQIREMSDSMRDEDISDALKLNRWALTNRLKPLTRGRSVEDFERFLTLCLDADYAYKNGKISPELATERLIVQCSGGKQ